jgi:hypothetical protein
VLLSQYQIAVRRLLNDSQKNYWPDSELTDYINEARRKVAVDTLCVRKFQPAHLTTGQEQYQFTDAGIALPQGVQVVDIINITVIWGQTRYQLGYLPFTQLSAFFRVWKNYTRLPCAFSIYNAREFWVAYVPDQDYETEYDTAITPLNLASDNDSDAIPAPYDEAVKYYAAFLARLKLQQYNEAKAQKQFFTDRITELGAMPPRRIPYVFDTDLF